MKLRYTPQAKSDLKEIHSYIVRDNPVAARKVVATIRRDITLLIDNPGLGRPGRVEGTRERVIARLPFIATYRIHGNIVEVLAVIHTARHWPKAF
ncbi:MAG: type II toxin-antitoxin system RelE/ParE family toxin [Gammaproteobacteria bacterium]